MVMALARCRVTLPIPPPMLAFPLGWILICRPGMSSYSPFLILPFDSPSALILLVAGLGNEVPVCVCLEEQDIHLLARTSDILPPDLLGWVPPLYFCIL